MRMWLANFTCVALLGGCASSSKPLPTIETSQSVRAYTKQLIRVTTPSAIDRMLESVTMKEHESSSFVLMSGWWCPDHVDIDGSKAVAKEYRKACTDLGGSLDSGICRSRHDPDDVLFYVSAVDGRRCSLGYPATEIVVVEPIGDRLAQEYHAQLKRLGFRNLADVKRANEQTENRRRILAANSAIETNKLKAQRERQRVANQALKVGDRICRTGLFQYRTSVIGGVLTTSGSMLAQFESHSPDKSRLQVRVLRAELPELDSRNKAQPIDVPRLGDLEAIPGMLYWDDAGVWQRC